MSVDPDPALPEQSRPAAGFVTALGCRRAIPEAHRGNQMLKRNVPAVSGRRRHSLFPLNSNGLCGGATSCDQAHLRTFCILLRWEGLLTEASRYPCSKGPARTSRALQRCSEGLSWNDREVIMRIAIRIFAPLVLLFAMLVPVGAATAAPGASERFEDSFFGFYTCSGEFVEGEGTVHLVNKLRKDGSVSAHFSFHATGTGDLGNEYVMHSGGKSFNSSDTFSFRQRIMRISKGPALNQVGILRVSPDGKFTFTAECRG